MKKIILVIEKHTKEKAKKLIKETIDDTRKIKGNLTDFYYILRNKIRYRGWERYEPKIHDIILKENKKNMERLNQYR